MTTTALGTTRFVKQGVYSAGAVYLADDVVLYNGKWYLCTATTTAGTLPTNASFFTEWQASFNWRGTHNNAATAYAVGDIVKYTTAFTTGTTNAGTFTRSATHVYRCILAHTSNSTSTFLPIAATYWVAVSLNTYNDGTVSLVSNNITEYWGVHGQSTDKCYEFTNYGRVDETETPYSKGNNKCQFGSYDRSGFITQNGQWRTWGLNTASCQPNNFTVGPHSEAFSFYFNDWFRSTNNGGAGVHSTPDGKIPRVIQVESGYDWWCILFNNGEVYHGGYGGTGESGDRSNSNRNTARVGGTYTETAVALNTTTHLFRNVRIKRISCSGGERQASSHHCMALDEDGEIWTWGYNAYGQLGDNSTTNRNIPTKISRAFFGLVSPQKVVAIWAAGGEYGYCFALTDQNTFWAWGYNGYGSLGLGNTTNRSIPAEVTTQVWTEAGVGTIRKLVTADTYSSTPYSATAILTSKGNIYVAGYNTSGAFMLNNTSQQNSFTQATSGPGSLGTANDVWLVSGQYPTMYVTDTASKKLWAAGANNIGQMGVLTTSVTQYSTAQECYKNIGGVDSFLTGVTKLSAISGGSTGATTSVAVVTENGLSFVVGRNTYGQLSLGWSGAAHYTTLDGNGRENMGSRAFTMVKMPPALIGQVADVQFQGYADASTTGYNRCTWVDRSGRVYQAGYNSSFSVTGTVSGVQYNLMHPVITS
jgi:alpha-tubulin suppressor-like RCC1 family protein